MKHRMTSLLCGIVLLVALAGPALAFETPACQEFSPGKWDPTAWTICKFPTVEHLGKWVQREQWIENETPADPASRSALDQTLTTMIYNKKLGGDFSAWSRFKLDGSSAGGLVVVLDWAPDAQGRPTYGEFYEVIAKEGKLSLWHHFTKDGRPTAEVIAYAPYWLKFPAAVGVARKGKSLAVSVGTTFMAAEPMGGAAPQWYNPNRPEVGAGFGVPVNSLPDDLFIGIEAGGGITQVNDFRVERP